MSTMVDNRWDPILQNQQGPITSGYVSNSDIRQRERKDQIKWERQREYEDLMNKRIPPVYYKTGASGNSLPLGSYEESRRTLDDQRQQEYNQFVAQKKDSENKRREELYRNSQQNYRPPPEPEMYDHGQIAKDLREERQKEYNDYLDPPSKGFAHHQDRKKMLSQERNNEYNEFLEKKKQKISEEHSRIKHRHRYTPAGGLPIGQYDLQRKRLRDELSRDYKQSLLKREQEIHTRRQVPPTPPGGLNIATEQERKRVEELKKTMYRDELLKQQKEQLYNRATQQGEVSVINRSSPTQAPPNQISPRGRPPPHPDSGRRRGPPPPQNDRMPMESHRPQEGELRTGFFDDRRQSPLNRDERQQDYQQFLANKQREDDMRHQRLEDQRHAPHLDLSKGDYYDAETYERKRQSLNSERKNDYQNFLSKKTPEQGRREWIDTSGPKGIIAGVDSYNYDKRKTFAEERKKEYKDIMEKQEPPRERIKEFGTPGAVLFTGEYEKTRQKVRDERTKDYHEFIQKHGGHAPRRMPDQAPANSIGFMANLGFHDREREKLNKERQGEYRKFLDEKAFGKEGMPRGRPNWVDGKVPPDSWFQQDPPPFHKSPVRDQEPPRDRPASYGRRQTPSYEEILDSKRREEASYRRFEDPEYSRAGGLGGPNDRYD